MKSMIAAGIAGALFSVFSACSGPPPETKSNEFFTSWLQHHGESNIVSDVNGIGLTGNSTRLRFGVYESSGVSNNYTSELEFRVRIPDGREIVEYVAGSGDTKKKAEEDAKVNFALSTFHVIYRGFLNPNDAHQNEEKITMNGQPRTLLLGDTMMRGQSGSGSPDAYPLRTHFREILSPLALSPQTHWIKIVYGNHHSNAMLCAATIDNHDSAELTEAVKKLAWPRQEEFYMVKQFILIK
jgi:hypothetical protein